MTTEEWAKLTDDQLVMMFWYSDALTNEEYRELEQELERRQLDPR